MIPSQHACNGWETKFTDLIVTCSFEDSTRLQQPELIKSSQYLPMLNSQRGGDELTDQLNRVWGGVHKLELTINISDAAANEFKCKICAQLCRG